jgi:rhodanese-related sulfurtransferase
MTIATLSPEEARAQIAQGARLIDIRDADEYAREHIPDAELVPLAALNNGATLHAAAEKRLFFIVRRDRVRKIMPFVCWRRRSGAGETAGWRNSGLESGRSARQRG